MKNASNNKTLCTVCEKEKTSRELILGSTLRDPLIKTIINEHPNWTKDDYICITDLNHYREKHLDEILNAEKGNLSKIEAEVAKSLKEEMILARNINSEFDAKITIGQKIADKVASFGGSWRFIGIFALIIISWICLNVFSLFKQPFDPFPFILLNLVLSCLAALQAPVIMMSQNRQSAKDRFQSEHDYQVNLKAEIEIRSINEKIDFITHLYLELMETQSMQIEMLEELLNKQSLQKNESTNNFCDFFISN